jgi:hypothetical protein
MIDHLEARLRSRHRRSSSAPYHVGFARVPSDKLKRLCLYNERIAGSYQRGARAASRTHLGAALRVSIAYCTLFASAKLDLVMPSAWRQAPGSC